MSFLSEFFSISPSDYDQAVLCPFEHRTANGLVYKENNPSAHVNTAKQVFHCKACGRGMGEAQFIELVLKCTPMVALRILKASNHAETEFIWREARSLSDAGKELAHSFKISDEVISELHLASPIGIDDSLQFPVFMHGMLYDVRTYTPGAHPKVKSRQGSINGLIIPYDVWTESPQSRVTVLCAGEKDMAVARSMGLNAITLTGGERTAPSIYAAFQDRIVAICYDNDDTGIQGAIHVARSLLPYTDKVKIVTGFHEVCVEPKEDLTDFFVKYGKTKEDLVEYIKNTDYYVPSEEDTPEEEKVPHCDLLTATNPSNINMLLQSNIQVVAVTDTTFTMPTNIILEKVKMSGDKDTLAVGETKEWSLTTDTLQDALHMIDNNFTEKAIKANRKTLLKVPQTERFMKESLIGRVTIFKAQVTDLFETNVDSIIPMEFQAYSFGVRLESGCKYSVVYKLVPHPYKGQQLTMLIVDAKQANDSVSGFILKDEQKEHLRHFQEIPGTVSEKVETLTEKVKGLLGYNGNNTLIQAIDLSYHTVLQFNLGSFSHVRGYLDTLVVGESRVGKSSTAEALRKTYNIGTFASLAGNSATIPGLVGGSNKTTSGFQTRAGVIPQNHKGLIIFEEFGKCKQDLVTELTDIRSSNEVRISRVSGTMVMPALVRMLSLSNVKASGNLTKPIASYPDGITIITELVGTAEDIARYDLILVLADRGTSQIDPYWQPQEAFAPEYYQTRVRWVWSRTPEQIHIVEDVGKYITERANALNQEFDSHIKIFGTEAWKKLTRLAIAVAGYTVSTDATYENIIVTQEHVDYAEEYMRRIYDNSTFKLREYVLNERMYSTIDDDGVAALQDLFTKNPALILQLAKVSVCSKNMLASASGLSADELNKALSRLTKALFIQYQGYDIVPTERFRLGMSRINRDTQVLRVGEQHAALPVDPQTN